MQGLDSRLDRQKHASHATRFSAWTNFIELAGKTRCQPLSEMRHRILLSILHTRQNQIMGVQLLQNTRILYAATHVRPHMLSSFCLLGRPALMQQR